jgi:hypothetical protein
MSDIPNLWPEEIGAEAAGSTPLAILRIAATQLGERTQQLIVGHIEQDLLFGNKFRLEFFLEVPSMDRYRFRLLQVEHDVDSFYPVKVSVMGKTVIARPSADLNNEKEFQEWLKQVFSSPGTTKLINTLLQQLRS